MRTPLTAKQVELWKLAELKLNEIGGTAAISRNKDPEVRALGKQAGTREWALLQSSSVAIVSALSDEECQALINCIN